MQFCYNTKPEETVAFLRERAIATRQPPAFIDAIDELRDMLDTPEELEKRDGELAAMEDVAGDLREELAMLVDQMALACEILESISKNPAEAADFFDHADLKKLQRQLSFAQKALERHNP